MNNEIKIAGALPEILRMADGTPVETEAQWWQHRPQLLQQFEREIYGRTLLGRPDDLQFVVREQKVVRDGRATRLRIGVLFEGRDDGRQMELLVYLPNDVAGPVPLFLGLNFDGNFATCDDRDLPLPTHFVNGLFIYCPDHRAHETQRGHNAKMWPYDAILARGYGVATACYGEIEPDMANQWWHGPRALGATLSGAVPGAGDWGALGAWAWALSRALDYLETEARVDAARVAVLGFSRLGKTALWAGAQDARFAAVISQNSGKGGISLSKRLTGEPVAHLANSLGHWFAPNYAKYADNEAALPVDGHTLAALIAPRPLLILSANQDTWSDPEGEFLSGQLATPLYQLFGHDGLSAQQWPATGTLINSRIGYYLRAGGHDVTAEDWAVTLDWADKHLSV